MDLLLAKSMANDDLAQELVREFLLATVTVYILHVVKNVVSV